MTDDLPMKLTSRQQRVLRPATGSQQANPSVSSTTTQTSHPSNATGSAPTGQSRPRQSLPLVHRHHMATQVTDSCGHTVETTRYIWTRIRPPHNWDSLSGEKTIRRRHRQGKTVNPDRHVYPPKTPDRKTNRTTRNTHGYKTMIPCGYHQPHGTPTWQPTNRTPLRRPEPAPLQRPPDQRPTL